MKVARTVLRGGNFSNKTTYLTRPYAALLLLITKYNLRVNYKAKIDRMTMEYLYLLIILLTLKRGQLLGDSLCGTQAPQRVIGSVYLNILIGFCFKFSNLII